MGDRPLTRRPFAGAALAAVALLAAASLPAACAKRATLNDALVAWQAGRHEAVVAACEEELARWEAADPEVAAALPAALADVRAMLADDPLLQTAEEAAGTAPPPDPERAPGDPAAALRDRGIDAGGGGGEALRALADDLFSDSPLRILRATEQVTGLSLRRLVPHLVANVYSPRPLEGDPGGLAAHPVGVRMLAVKAWETRAVRAVLLGAPAPPGALGPGE